MIAVLILGMSLYSMLMEASINTPLVQVHSPPIDSIPA